MNLLEAGKLLTVAAGFDNRKVDEVNATAWLSVLQEFQYRDAEAAVIAHHRDPLTRHEYLTVGHVLDRLERSVRARTADVEADVRSAKARGLVASSWPAREPLPADVAEKLAQARERDRVTAEQYAIEAPDG